MTYFNAQVYHCLRIAYAVKVRYILWSTILEYSDAWARRTSLSDRKSSFGFQVVMFHSSLIAGLFLFSMNSNDKIGKYYD